MEKQSQFNSDSFNQIQFLTKHAIKDLVQNFNPEQSQLHQNQNKQLVLQVLGLQENCQHEFKCFLSDGFTKINCCLSMRAKLMAQTQQLKNLSVVIIKENQLKLKIPELRKDISSILRDCTILKAPKKFIRPIGQPILYHQYQENKYENPKGQIRIQKGFQYYSIIEIKSGGYKWCSLKAKIIFMPKNISKGFLNIKVQDDQEQTIQLVCYDEIAQKTFAIARNNKTYIIKDFILQSNKRTNDLQLKLIKTDSMTPFETNQNKQFQNININLIDKDFKKLEPNQSFALKNSQGKKAFSVTQIFQLIPKYQEEPFDFDLIAIVKEVIQKKIGRILKIKDQFNKEAELLLWSQISDPIQRYNVYIFKNLKISFKKSTPQFQSNRNTTIQQIFQKQQLKNKSEYSLNENEQKMHFNENFFKKSLPENSSIKSIPSDANVISLQEMIQESPEKFQDQRTIKTYAYCLCYIEIRMRSFDFPGNNDKHHFFQLYCNQCSRHSQHKSSYDIDEKENGQLFCTKCGGKECSIKWNLKVKAVDTNTELLCSLQDQITEKFLQTRAKVGYNMYKRNKDQLHNLLLKLNYVYRTCKFMIKSSIRDQRVQKYYNILEIYRQGPTIKTIQNNLKTIYKNLQKIAQIKERKSKKESQLGLSKKMQIQSHNN